jgi:hypothetical protein
VPSSEAGSSVAHTGDALTLTLHLSFSSAFVSNKLLYTAARDSGRGPPGGSRWGGLVGPVGHGSVQFE